MQPFEYTVLFVANGGDGKSSANCLSRAIVLAPKHDEDALFICFLRREAAGASGGKVAVARPRGGPRLHPLVSERSGRHEIPGRAGRLDRP